MSSTNMFSHQRKTNTYLKPKTNPNSNDEVGCTVSAQVWNPYKNKVKNKVVPVSIVQTPNPHAAGQLKDPPTLNNHKLNHSANKYICGYSHYGNNFTHSAPGEAVVPERNTLSNKIDNSFAARNMCFTESCKL